MGTTSEAIDSAASEAPFCKACRIAATALAGVLLLAGTLWGSDDYFPFGPFSMYAGVNPPDEPAPDPRIEAVTIEGRVLVLGERETGLRRAELEGKQQIITADPALLDEVAQAYRRRNPAATPLAEIRYVMRWHEIKSSRPTGAYHDEVLAALEVRP